MPLYEYHCRNCGDFTLLRIIDRRDDDANCPECGVGGQRVIAAPALSLMPAGRREAFSRNEKSRHEPGILQRHHCHSRCGCSTPGKRPGGTTDRTIEIPKLGKFQRGRKNRRPWMLGH